MENAGHQADGAAMRWFVLLFILGSALRLVWLGHVPNGLNQDEASIGYAAWALLHYGIDRNGFSWPVNLVAWGSGQNVLYAYLSMPFIALAGLSVLSIRMLAAFLGLVAMWLFWRLGRKAGAGMAPCALLLIATSPWHIMASRWALESNILPAVVLIAVYAFALAPERPRVRLPLAAGVLALSIYAYGPAYMFAPLFLLVATILIARRHALPASTITLSFVVAALVALPMMGFLLNNWLGSTTVHIGPISLPHYSGPARYGNIFLPFAENGWTQTLENAKLVIGLIFGGYDDGMPANAVPGWGPQYVILAPFVLWGAVYATRPAAPLIDRLMLAWFACALLTAVVTEANINRINLVWMPSLWMGARGLWMLRDVKILIGGAAAVVLICCLLFSAEHFTSWRKPMADAFFEGLVESMQEAVREAPPDAPIDVTGQANMPYITALFVARTPPQRFIDTAEIPDRTAAFQSVTAFDRFRFGIRPETIDFVSYWVVHRGELDLFDPARFAIRMHGDYAFVKRVPTAAQGCEKAIEASSVNGTQDFGSLGEDGEVNNSQAGFAIGSRHFTRGLGVHGDSEWHYRAAEGIQSIRFGVALSESSQCSDGMQFRVLADGKPVYESAWLRAGDIDFQVVDLHGAHDIGLQTLAGENNSCDHGNWLSPVVSTCAH